MNRFRRLQSLLREPLLRRADKRELAEAEAALSDMRAHPPGDEDFLDFLEQAEQRTAKLRSVIAGYGTVSPEKLEQAEDVLRDLHRRKAAGRYTGGPRRYGYAVESARARVERIRTELSHQRSHAAASTEGTPC